MIAGSRRESSPAAVRAAVLVDVIIEFNAGPAPEYRLTVGRRPRLVSVHRPASEGLPGDIGHVADSLDPAGRVLGAIVVATASMHPGAVVPSQVVGLVQANGAERAWLVVEPFDGTGGPAPGCDGLTSDFHGRLRAFLGSENLRWTPSDESERLAREAIERGRRAKAQERAERFDAEAAWTVSPGTQRRWALFEGEPHTQTEINVLRAPYRFQLYLREVLLPQERLLASVHCQPISLGHGPFRRQTTHEAMVVLTDQQLLVLADARAPDSTVPIGGFVARSTAVERISAVQVERREGHIRLCVDILSEAAGAASWTILARADAGLEALAADVARFVPAPGQILPARRGYVDALDVDTTGWDAFFALNERGSRREQLSRMLRTGEQLLAWALAPPGKGGRARPTAVALTSDRFVVLTGESTIQSWSTAELSSVELADSPFASELRLWAAGQAPCFRLPFPFTISPAFLDLFLTTRRRLADCRPRRRFPVDGPTDVTLPPASRL